MTTTIITGEYLERFVFDFGSNKKNFYEEFFNDVSNREASIACGFIVRKNCNLAQKQVKNRGRLRASRFKLACTKLHKNPDYFISKFQPQVLQFGHRKLYTVGEELRGAVYRTICDST